MLLNLREYHRPAGGSGRQAIDTALALLARDSIVTVPLAGGDTLLASADPTVEAVVDLQGLGLDTIALEDGRLRIGAMVTRATLADNETICSIYGGILAEGARRWGGSIQRNRATVGGAIATAASNDPLVAALLACDAVAVLYTRSGPQQIPLADFLLLRRYLLAAPALITDLLITPPTGSIGAALATVARTPADAPIVLAVAVLTVADGRCVAARLALGGVAGTPVCLPQVEALLTGQPLTLNLIAAAAIRASELVHPTGDFRGSGEYRKAMAGVLSERALRAARERCEAHEKG